MFGPFIERAQELFDDVTLRLYMASVVGRLGRRVFAGAHRVVNLQTGVPGLLLENTTRDRALLGCIISAAGAPAPIIFSPSIDAGPSNPTVVVGTNGPGGDIPDTQIYVLRPSEQLFGTNVGAPTSLITTTEYF